MSPIIVTIIALSIIFLATTLGASLVFFVKKSISSKSSNAILGFASGIMIAAAIFGLLIPAIDEASETYKDFSLIPVIGGFILGGLFLNLLDKVVPHLHTLNHEEEGYNAKNVTKNLKFFLAVTIHNIPEGLAVGVACGLALSTKENAAVMSALSLAIGIAIQNFPEGAAVSIPMLESNVTKPKSFVYGMLSGVVEPVFGLIGIFLASSSNYLMPWLLTFASGAMIYVTLDELLPSSRKDNYPHYGMWAFMIGFSLMLILEMVL